MNKEQLNIEKKCMLHKLKNKRLVIKKEYKNNESTVRSCFVIDHDPNNESLYTKEYLRKVLSDNIGKLVTKNLNNIL